MKNKLKNAIAKQLNKEDAAIFKYGEHYIHIYGRNDADWAIDVYESMDTVERSHCGIVDIGTAAKAIKTALRIIKNK